MPNEPSSPEQPPDPHHALNNPATDPDPTEWPDPYDKRPDPRDPADPDEEPFGDDAHPAPGAISTSEPHPDQDIEANPVKPRERDKLDD
ncbi:MAG: hypothetical protein JO304_17915 [Solirubrobacterales bacterium]|nr:hypothetical protein [Solirubrobacterales bacterium]